MERKRNSISINPDTLALPDNSRWSAIKFDWYLAGVAEHTDLLDMQAAPAVIDLGNSIVGETADRLAKKLEEGNTHEHASQIRRRRDGSVYSTDLVTGNLPSMTFTTPVKTDMSDTIRAFLFNINSISRLSRRYPPETVLFGLHSHPYDAPVHVGDVETLAPIESSDLIMGPFRQNVGTLIVADSVRMLTLATKQTPQYKNHGERNKSIKDIAEEATQVVEELGLNTFRSMFKPEIDPEKYPELVRASIWSWTRISHRMNYLMYTSLVDEENSNLYTRSF